MAPRTKRRYKRRNKRKGKSLAKEVQLIKKTLARSLPPKVHKLHTHASTVYVTATPTVINITGEDYVGVGLPMDATTLFSLDMRLCFNLTTAADDTELVRCCLVRDNRKFDNNTAPTWADVFESSDVYTGRVASDTVAKTPSFRNSFSVLKDVTFKLQAGTGFDDSKKIIRFRKSFGKAGIDMYNGTNYQKNQLYLMYVGTSAGTTMSVHWFTDWFMRQVEQEAVEV